MRALVLVVIAACSSSAAPPAAPKPAPPVPIANEMRTCSDAAAGLERATRGVRSPDESILGPMQLRCNEDSWPALAIECFASMKSEDLGRCAVKLVARDREAMFAVLGGTEQDQASVAIIVARLSALKVGILNCDRFVSAVTAVMACEGMSIEQRVQLGSETADFWSLPTSGLPIDAQAKMAAACGKSLQALQQQAVDVGCMP